jgi:hypothetical protein
VRISAAGRDGRWAVLWHGDLPNLATPAAVAPYGFFACRGVEAVRLKVEILSGYVTERCGLDSIAFFGDGASYQPDGQPCSVSADITGLSPGTTIHARLVLEDGDDVIRGDSVDITIPTTQAPCLFEAVGWLRADNPPCIAARASAMGLPTAVTVTLTLDDGSKQEFGAVDLGMQPTSRHIYYNLPNDVPMTTGKAQLTLRNAAGEAAVEVAWPPTRSPPSFITPAHVAPMGAADPLAE